MPLHFGAKAHDHALLNVFVDAGFDHVSVENAINAGLSWSDLITLAIKYGKLLVSAFNDVFAMIRDGHVSAAYIQSLIEKYGPDIEAMIRDILSRIGLAYPTA